MEYCENESKEEVPYYCNMCYEYLSTSRTIMSNHMESHSSDNMANTKGNMKGSKVRVFSCEQCGFSCKWKQSLKYHIVRIHNGENSHLKCDHCPKTFLIMKYLKHHIRYTHSAPLQCKLCGIELLLGPYRDHMKYKHGNTEKYECGGCGKMFFRPYKQCKGHDGSKSNKGNGAEIMQCENKCGFTSRWLQGLRKHKTRGRCNPDKPLIRSFSCIMCGKLFSTEKSKLKHEQIHVEGKPFKCDQCSVNFTNTWNMKKHKKDYCNPLKNL